MSLLHVSAGEVINLQSLNTNLPKDKTFALVKTSDMEVIRMVIPAGKKIPEHKVAGQISVQCISGHTAFAVESVTHQLKPGDWLYLDGNQVHSLHAITDSVLLVTILLAAKS